MMILMRLADYSEAITIQILMIKLALARVHVLVEPVVRIMSFSLTVAIIPLKLLAII